MLSLIISSSILSSAPISLIKLSSLSLAPISLISSHLLAHVVTVAVPAHSHLSHLSSSHLSHLSSSHLPAVAVAIPRRPSPRLNPRCPSRSTSGQCSLFFCNEFLNLGVCCFGLIFLGLVLFCGKKWCCPYVVLDKIKKTFVLE